jgi:hypothetical protein
MRKVLAIGVGLLLAGCASTRGVEVGSEPSTSYAIQVTNNRGSSVQISYTDGGNRIQLGTVASGGSERFIIASPQSSGTTTRITVR